MDILGRMYVVICTGFYASNANFPIGVLLTKCLIAYGDYLVTT
jgi:hypothetical protein